MNISVQAALAPADQGIKGVKKVVKKGVKKKVKKRPSNDGNAGTWGLKFASVDLGRQAIGIEIEERSCEIAVNTNAGHFAIQTFGIRRGTKWRREFTFKGTIEIEEIKDPTLPPTERDPNCHIGRRMILRAAPGGTGVSTGALQVKENIDSRLWTEEQVRQYQYCEMQFFQRMAMFDPSSVYDKVSDLKKIAPEIKVLSLIRPDIAWYAEDQEYVDADIAWGSAALSRPTKAMGATPKTGKPWAQAAAKLQAAGYRQNEVNKSKTGNTLTCPYQIGLNTSNPSKKEWLVRSNSMDVTNADWRELKTDAYCFWHEKFPDVDGVLIGPIKHNFAAQATAYPDDKQFHLWLEGFNEGWELKTNSGGALQGSWGTGSTWKMQAVYDNKPATVRDIFEDGWAIARKLKQKRPQMLVGYDSLYLNVPLNVTTSRFLNEYTQDTGQTEQQAITYFIDRHFEMAELCDMFMFPEETGVPGASIDNIWSTCPIPKAQRDELRDITCQKKGIWCSYPPNPFTI